MDRLMEKPGVGRHDVAQKALTGGVYGRTGQTFDSQTRFL